jgi:choline kinase
MRAILLVAGVGRRLGRADQPKSMLEFGGKTLIARHVEALAFVGCTHLTLVVGHLREAIEAEIARIARNVPSMTTKIRVNDHYREGSVVSLWVAREDLSSTEATVVMDGDVLYDAELLLRLRDDGGASAFLVDPRSDETGEEMMVAVRGGRARRIARRVGKGDAQGNWDSVGESVGFLKIGPQHATPMRAMLEAHLSEGDAGHRNTEYEAVYDKFLDAHEVGVVPVGEAPWTEIDFEADVVRARDSILPGIEARRTKPS